MTKSDKEWFETKLENKLNQHLAPIREMAQKHEQSLYGERGDGGLRDGVDKHEIRLDGIDASLQEGRGRRAALMGAIGAGAGLVGALASKLIKLL